MKTNKFCKILLVLLLFAQFGCGGDDDDGGDNPIQPTSPVLQASPNSLDFGRSSGVEVLSIANKGTGTLDWQAATNYDWISLNPSSGSATSETDHIAVSVNRSGLDIGDESGTIIVSSNGGTDTILVELTKVVPLGPEYFPMADGDTWYYTNAIDEQIIRTVSGDTTIALSTCRRVLHNGITAEAWSIDSSATDTAGYYVHMLTGDDIYVFVPPLAIPFNLEMAGPHNYNSQVFVNNVGAGSVSGQLSFVDYGKVQILGRIFESVIQLHYTPDGEPEYYEFYAPYVGLLNNGDIELDSAFVGGVWYRP
ncbi:MAG: hypothetical protein V3V99_11925 [candidate division Zixibacteria bacterium]